MIYTPLGIKTEYSLLNSMIKINDLVKFAKENHIKALSITDDNMCGVMEFYKACINNDIKPIIGLEIKIENKKIILYSKNYEGYKNLLSLESIKIERELELSDLKNNNSNLICIIPYEEKEIYENLNFFENIYIGYKNQQEYEDVLEKGIYINEIKYLEKSDNFYFKYLIAIKNDTTIDKIEYLDDNHLVLETDINIDLTNNYKIYDLCNVQLEFKKSLLPKYNCPNNYSSHQYLTYLCKEGLKRIFGDKVGIKYIERLKYELSVIEELNFSDYFLIVWDYVNYAKKDKILIGPGRGSSAGSLVSYCLNIIEIDPLKYDLVFERFLNKERITMPDIDVDFDGTRKEEVIDYCKEKYGLKHVANIITFSSLTAKQVIRDVGKVMGLNEESYNFLSKMFKPKMSLMDNYNENDRIKNHLNRNPELNELFKISLKLENIKRHISQHASGVVIADKDIDEIIPLVKINDIYLTGYTMEHLEQLGLIKMDFLSLKTLTTIDTIISDIKEISYNDIPLNDPKTIEIFNKGKTLGIFQFESDGMIKFLKQVKCKNFEDIYNVIALYRPGPMDNINSYIKRRKGIEEINYFSPSLENILKSTYGIIIYQEQIMKIANVMANYTLGEADILRKAMSKKKEDILIKEKDKFINKALKNGYNIEIVNEIYNLILKFAEYGFPKAHAVAYSVISYKMAYIKANYTIYFMKYMLNSSLGSSYDLMLYIKESKENNIKILQPNINHSNLKFEIETSNLRFPFLAIKNIGFVVANNIVSERSKGKFIDIFDFLRRVDRNIINKEIFEYLVLAGCFDEFNLTRKTLIENIDILYNYADLVADLGDVEEPIIENIEDYSFSELMRKEYDLFGFYLNNHPVNEYRKKYDSRLTINNISGYLKRYASIIAKVDSKREIQTKKQEKMCFVKLSDEFSTIEATIFSSYYEKMPPINEGDIVRVHGRINRKDGKDQILVNRIDVIDKYN